VTATRSHIITPLVSSVTAAFLLTTAVSAAAQTAPAVPDYARQVEIRRTTHGVPHIKAENLAAAAYALGYVQLEDYGARVAMGLLRARGEMGRWFGRDSMDGDFGAQREYALAVENYARLEQPTRDVYEGFAAGVNRYIELHRAEYPAGMPTDFSGYDVASLHIGDTPPTARIRRFLAAVKGGASIAEAMEDSVTSALFASSDEPVTAEDGSNAWALAPTRTTSGRAILLRNPHLAWTSGYYEAHMTVSGVMDFYGDFRIGGPFGVIGGFNKDLGWSTTNNAPDLDEIYALDVDPARADRYLFDGTSLPLERELTTVTYRNGPGLSTETRESWRTPLGPVIWRITNSSATITRRSTALSKSEASRHSPRAHSTGALPGRW